MTDQPLIEPDPEDAEALMDHAAADLRAHMNTALANLTPQWELLINLAGAGLTNPPTPAEQPAARTPA